MDYWKHELAKIIGFQIFFLKSIRTKTMSLVYKCTDDCNEQRG